MIFYQKHVGLERSNDYFVEKRKRNREIERQLGVRYRNSQEANLGETFTDFKHRMKRSKLMGAFCLGMVFAFQLTGIIL